MPANYGYNEKNPVYKIKHCTRRYLKLKINSERFNIFEIQTITSH